MPTELEDMNIVTVIALSRMEDCWLTPADESAEQFSCDGGVHFPLADGRLKHEISTPIFNS